MSGAARQAFAYTQARVQARYAGLPLEADWRRISGTRGLGGWLEEARGGPLKHWVKGFSAASDVHDLEAGIRKLLLAEIDAVAGFVPEPWRAAVHWTRWLALLPVLERIGAGAELPAWVRRSPCIAALLDEAGAAQPARLRRAGLAALLTTDPPQPLAQRWGLLWRARWPDSAGPGAAQLDALAARLARHLDAFRRSDPARAWTLRQQLRERLQTEFHRLGLAPAMPFIYLALVALDLERLRRALLDRALFPESSLPQQDAA